MFMYDYRARYFISGGADISRTKFNDSFPGDEVRHLELVIQPCEMDKKGSGD